MVNMIDMEAIKRLSTAEKKEIIEAIQETIIEEDYNEGIPEDYEEEETEEELQLIEERLKEYEANPNDVISWNDFLKEYRAERK